MSNGQFKAMWQCKWYSLVQVVPLGHNPIGQSNAMGQCRWLNLESKFVTNASFAILWSNWELMQVVPSGGQIWNLCKWHHLVAKFEINASGTIWWPNLGPMQVSPSADQCFVVTEFSPGHGVNFWVHCDSGNVLYNPEYILNASPTSFCKPSFPQPHLFQLLLVNRTSKNGTGTRTADS